MAVFFLVRTFSRSAIRLTTNDQRLTTNYFAAFFFAWSTIALKAFG